MPRRKILCIIGASRSGSTLLDRMFGSMNRVASLGEVHNLWRRGFLENHQCGCGLPFHQCPEWHAIRRSINVEDSAGASEVLRWQADVVRNRNIPRLIRAGSSCSSISASHSNYRRILLKLYAAASYQLQAPILVDSSKRAAHGFLLHSMRDELDVTYLHLVRDSRAMAFSAMREKPKVDAGLNGGLMTRLNARQSATGWIRQNLLCEALCHSVERSYRLRYEDLVADPGGTLERVAASLSLPSNFDWLDGSNAQFSEGHTVSGNPMRMKQGPVNIRLDDEWMSSLGGVDRRLITTLTLPLLSRYGYALRPERF